MQILKILGPSLILFTIIFCVSTPARADSVTFTPGNHPQPDEQNVLLNGGTTGTIVFGSFNQANLQVAFSSGTDTLVVPSSGQARIEADDGTLNSITISIPTGTFHDIIFNPFSGTGTANVSVVTAGNQASNFAYALGNGQNFLTIVADPGTAIFSVTISAAGGFPDLRQVRISGASNVTPGPTAIIPEPATMLLFGSGVLGAATALWKRRRS
jgi:hypothetical protein